MKKLFLLLLMSFAFVFAQAQTLLPTVQDVTNASDSVFINLNDVVFIQDLTGQQCIVSHPNRLKKTFINQYYAEIDSTIKADYLITFIDSDTGDTIGVNKDYIETITMVPVDSTANIKLKDKLFKKFITTETFYAIKNGL